MAPELPEPRGELGAWLNDTLRGPALLLNEPPVIRPADPLTDEDFQLSLYVLYELHYRGFEGVDSDWEWEPSLLAVRGGLERTFEDAVRSVAGPVDANTADVPAKLAHLLEEYKGPPLGRYLETQAPIEQFREFVVHRSAYQLKEADPHSWAIARLPGRAKVARAEIQPEGEGAARRGREHARLYAQTMEAIGLDP